MSGLDHLSTVGAQDRYRELFQPLQRENAKGIFSRYFKEGNKVIEFGSGLGYLVDKLLPEYKGVIQQTDGEQEIVAKHKAMRQGSNIVFTDIYRPTVQANSYDIAVGLNTFDSAMVPDAAMSSISRVLSPTGLLMHFRDLFPMPTRISDFPYDKSEHVPFLARDDYGHTAGIRLVRRRAVETSKRINDIQRVMLLRYGDNPDRLYSEIIQDSQTRHDFADLGQRISSQAPVIRFDHYFAERLKSALERTGFEILEVGRATRESIEARSGIATQYPSDNVFIQEGHFKKRFDPNVKRQHGKDKIKVIANLDYLVVRKR